ncbi:hypothetical protein M9H77_30393 [Catharanthus roseus]|uniref:Uncharacterized protein n=1 Tax=Catharanthus roseus TaxID=4058 RepID=A0ACC0A122_CATRO|nr:hypothetical protein M9H77_30393 [Catharanthus roseus]
MPTTPVIRYFLENILCLPVVENFGTKALSADAHPVHNFINELSSIVALPHLPSSINLSMGDIDEGIEECSKREHNAEEKEVWYNENLVKEFYGNLCKDFGNLESLAYGQVYVRGHVIYFSPANSAHYLSCTHFSDIEGTSLEEEADFDEVTKEEDQHMHCYLQKHPQVRALNPLVMPKIVAPSMVSPSPIPSTPRHTGLGRFLMKHKGLCSSLVFDLKQCQRGSLQKPITQLEGRHTGIEVVLQFNSVEDLKGFKIKQLVSRVSLEELKEFNCAVYKGTLIPLGKH